MLISQSNSGILKAPVSSESVENSLNNDLKTRLEEKEELSNNNLLLISAVRLKYSTEDAEKLCDHQYVKVKPNRTSSKLENHLRLNFPTKLQTNVNSDNINCVNDFSQQDTNNVTEYMANTGLQTLFGSGKGPPIPEDIPSGSLETSTHTDSTNSSKTFSLSIKETLNEIKGSLGLVLRAKNKGLIKANKSNNHRSNSSTDSVSCQKNESYSQKSETSCCKTGKVSGKDELDFDDHSNKSSIYIKENIPECSKSSIDSKTVIDSHHELSNEDTGLETKTSFHLDHGDVKDLELSSGFQEEERISTVTSPLSLDESSIQGREVPTSNGDEETESEEGVKLWLDETSSDTNEFGKQDILDICINDYSVPSTSKNPIFPDKEIKTEMSPHEDFNNDAPPPLIPLVEPCILDAPVSPEMPVLTPVLDTREISNRESFSELHDKVKKELFPFEEEDTDKIPLSPTSLVQQSCRYPKVPQVLLEPLSVQLLEKHRSYVSLSSSANVCCDSKTSFDPLFHKTKITIEKNCHPSKDNQRQTRVRGSRQHKTQNKKTPKERKELPQNGVLTRKKFRELSLKSANDNNRTKYLENAVQNEKNADVDMIVIDGIEFFSFETEEALKEYTRQDLNKKPTLSVNDDSDSSWPKDLAEIDAKDLNCERPIIPTKTNDITKIKGWRNKVFASETTPVNPSPIYGAKKINWAKRIQLRRQLSRVDRKKTDLLTLMKRRRLRIRTRRFNKKVWPRNKKSFAKLVRSINEKPKLNNSNYKSTAETEVSNEDSKIKEIARTDDIDLEEEKNKAIEENQKETTVYDSSDKSIDKELASNSSDVPKYRFINEKRDIQIETSLNDLAASNPKPIPNFMKAFKTKYGWFQKIGNALIPVGEVSDDIPRYVPALSKSISRPSSLELVTLKSEDAEFAASALYCPEDENKKKDSGVQLTSISLEMAQMAVTAVMNYPIPNNKWEKKSGKRPVKIKEEPPFENSYKTRTSIQSSDKQLCNNIKVESVERLTENASKCGKSFCSFGCVCDSLKTRRRGRRHCGKVDCMFSCICNRTSSDIQIEARSENIEAKNIIMTDEGPIKRRRATRLPARLLDSAFIWTKGKELLIDPDLDVSYRNKRVRLENKHLKSKSSESPINDKSRSILNKRHVSTRQSQQETVRLKSPKMKFQNEKCKTPKVPPLKITNLLAKSGFPASVQEWTVVSNSTGTLRENDCNSHSPKDTSPKSVKSEKQSCISPKQTSLWNLGKHSDVKQSSAQLFNDKQDKIKIIGNSFKFNNESLITNENDHLTIFRKTPDFDKQHKTESCIVEHTTGYLVPKNLIKNSTLKSILSSPESIPVRVLKSQFTSHKSHNEFGSPIIGIYSIRGVSSHAFIGPIPYKIVAKSNLQTLDGQRLLKKPTEILSPSKFQSPTNFEDRTTSLSFQCTAQTTTDESTKDSDSKISWKRYCSVDDNDIILCLDDVIKKVENEVKSFCNKSEQLTKNLEDGFTQVFIRGNKILQKLPNGNVAEFTTSKRKQSDSNTTKPSEHPTKKPSLDASICKPLSVVLTKCDPDRTVVLPKDFCRTNKSPIDSSKTKEKNSPRLLSAEVAPLAWNKNHEPSVPKNKKERLRRHEIFQCFVRLCAVLDPTAVNSWKKNYEKIPSKVIILKKAKQCIRELELYSCNMRKLKKALIKRRNSLFNHYSQLLKVLPTDVQKKTVLKLTKSLKQCCAVRKNRSQTQTTWEPDMDYFLPSQCKSRLPSTREVIEVSSDDDDDDDEMDEEEEEEEDPTHLESDGNSSGGHLSNAQDTTNVNYMEVETWQSDENEVGSPPTCVVAVPSRRASEVVSSDKPVEMDCKPYNLISEAIENPPSKVVIVNDSAQRMYKSRLKMFSPVNSQLAKRLHHSNVTTTINGVHYLKSISYTDTTQNSLVTPYTVFSSEGHLVCNESDENQIVNRYEGDKVHQHLQEMISPDNSKVYFDNSEQLYINSYSNNSETAESGNIDLLSNAIPSEDISEGPNVIIVGKPQMIPAPTIDGNAQDGLIISDPSYIVANYNDLGALTALQNKTVDSSVAGMEISSKMASDINSYGGSVAEYVVMEGSVLQNSNVMPVDVFPVEPRFGKETLETSKSKEVISEHFEDIVLPNDDSVSDEISIELPKIIACSSITEAEFLAEEC